MSHAHASLLAPSNLWSRDEVLRTPCPVPAAAGVYAWFFRVVPPGVPTEGCVTHQGLTLPCVGIAPKVPPRTERTPSAQTLRGRVRHHYRGNADGTTPRLTLSCLLSKELGLELRRGASGQRLNFTHQGEASLSAWLGRNAFITWLPHPAPWTVEEGLILRLSLPLNLDRNRRHPFHPTLSAARRDAKARARALPALPEG